MKKIVVLTDNTESFQSFYTALCAENYEVLISESCLNELVHGDTRAVVAFDLLVIDESCYMKIPLAVILHLEEIGKALTVVSSQATGQLVEKLKNENAISEISKIPHPKPEELSLGVYRAFPKREYVLPKPVRLKQTKKEKQYRFTINNQGILVDEQLVTLTPKELELFTHLVKRHPNLVSHEELFQTIWNKKYDLTKQPFLSNLVMKIRNKVHEQHGSNDSIIINRKGEGYKINERFRVASVE